MACELLGVTPGAKDGKALNQLPKIISDVFFARESEKKAPLRLHEVEFVDQHGQELRGSQDKSQDGGQRPEGSGYPAWVFEDGYIMKYSIL